MHASVSAREGRRESAAGWRSLPRAAASASGSPERRAASRAGDAAKLGDLGTGGEPVELPVDGGGRESAVGHREDPVEDAADLDRGQLLAASGAERGPADQAERHVAAQLGADGEEFVAARAGPPQGVAGDQGGGAVGAAVYHAARDRDVLRDVQVDGRVDAVPLGQGQRGAGGEVGGVQRYLGGVRSRAGDAQRVGGGGGDLVVQADGEEDVGQVVEAVGAGRADGELDVDLGGDADGDGGAHAGTSGLFSAIAANSSTVSASPRACGEIPAAVSAASAAGAEPS